MTADEATSSSRSGCCCFDVDGVLTDGVGHHARRRIGVQGLPHPRRRGAWSGRSARADGRAAVGADRPARPRSARRSSAIRIVVQGVDEQARAPTSGSCATAGLDRQRGRLHGRRPAGPAGAGARRALGGAGRRGPEVRVARDWVSTAGGGRGAVREFIELVLRAQGRWDDVVRAIRPAGPDGTPTSPCSRRCSPCWPASPSARPGSATSCRTAAGSIAAARASRRTTCSA